MQSFLEIGAPLAAFGIDRIGRIGEFRRAIDRLKLSHHTRLYQGILAALSAAGRDGQRRLLVLADGRDTTRSPLSTVRFKPRRTCTGPLRVG